MKDPVPEGTPEPNTAPRAELRRLTEEAAVKLLAILESEAADPKASPKVRFQARRMILDAAASFRRADAKRHVLRPAKKPEAPAPPQLSGGLPTRDP